MAPSELALGVALSLVAYRLVVLAHELGHAAVALAGSEGLVGVRVGRSPSAWRIRLGRLQLGLHPLPARREADGNVTVYARLGRAWQVAYTLAGPVAGCSAAVLFAVAGARSHLWVLVFAGCLLFGSEVSNLWPAEHRGLGSDGAQLLVAIRAERRSPRADPVVDVETRWLVLVTDSHRALAGRDRDLFLGVLPAVGRASTDRSDEAQALVRFAFCGWCWREAEREDAASIPDSLDKGLRCARNNVSSGSLPPEQVRFAFRFGAALRDETTVTG